MPGEGHLARGRVVAQDVIVGGDHAAAEHVDVAAQHRGLRVVLRPGQLRVDGAAARGLDSGRSRRSRRRRAMPPASTVVSRVRRRRRPARDRASAPARATRTRDDRATVDCAAGPRASSRGGRARPSARRTATASVAAISTTAASTRRRRPTCAAARVRARGGGVPVPGRRSPTAVARTVSPARVNDRIGRLGRGRAPATVGPPGCRSISGYVPRRPRAAAPAPSDFAPRSTRAPRTTATRARPWVRRLTARASTAARRSWRADGT